MAFLVNIPDARQKGPEAWMTHLAFGCEALSPRLETF